MSAHFDRLWEQAAGGFGQSRTAHRARQLAYGLLTACGRRTVSGLLTASGQQFADWSAAYRLFSAERLAPQGLFEVVLRGVLEELGAQAPIVAHLDDTLLRKTGRKIPGAKWRRDPLGPPFHPNFIWGQRFVQLSLALPETTGAGRARAIPVEFHHSPSPLKPGKSASPAAWAEFRGQQKQTKLSRVGAERIRRLRRQLDRCGAEDRPLVVSVDGSYTNREVIKTLPAKTTLIGRIRKDAKLYELPAGQPQTGRKRVYGNRLPTPEQIRQNKDLPWKSLQAYAAGRMHTFKVKTIAGVRWRPAGADHTLRLVVIRPLSYRLNKSSRLLYRQPAYLICTDPQMPLGQLLQRYLWRWEIEVNFREQKTLLGCGQAQVRHPQSVQTVPAFITAVYSFLLLAAHRAAHGHDRQLLPRAKWYPRSRQGRQTTGDILNLFRAELWAKTTGMSFSSFVNHYLHKQTLKKQVHPIISAFTCRRN